MKAHALRDQTIHSDFALFQSFFGFGQSAEIDIVLEGQDTRKTAEIKTEDGKKERHYLYYDGESVAGKVRTRFVLYATDGNVEKVGGGGLINLEKTN